MRLIAYVSDGQVRGLSRIGNDVTASYPELAELADLVDGHRVVLDGEIVALEPGDRPSFSRLQQRMLLRTFMILNVSSKGTGSSGPVVRDRRG